MNKKQVFLISLLGLGFGLGIGLLVAWVLAPVQFIDTTPASLRVDFKDEYRFMIASAFAANSDLLRAQARLDTLSDPDPIKVFGQQAQRMLANNSPMSEIQVLTDLSTALQSQPTVVYSPVPAMTDLATDTLTPTPTIQATPTTSPSPTETITSYPSFTPTPTATQTVAATLTPQQKPISTLAPRSTQTSSPKPSTPFKLVKQSTICDPAQPGLLQVNLSNSDGKPAAGVELVITWLGGEEHFFTGLKPELGYGYADYSMTGNIEYALSLSDGGTRLTGLSTPKCTTTQGNTYPGGLDLEFKRP